MGRASTSSDASSRLSTSSTLTDATAASYTKDDAEVNAASAPAPKKSRRGFRQKARDVVADLGHPPTLRQDLKDNKPVKTNVNYGMMGFAPGLTRPRRL